MSNNDRLPDNYLVAPSIVLFYKQSGEIALEMHISRDLQRGNAGTSIDFVTPVVKAMVYRFLNYSFREKSLVVTGTGELVSHRCRVEERAGLKLTGFGNVMVFNLD
ncbi:hypothetical protein AVEN_195989-1 [Araneus ventricosus]|uniref:Uncharacterized protein n=1 Tax=Araneus ventricosus TaxID=182803 RepID=A0A4Y2DRA4_ARAVE|nr:hypothetical protein AVEN_195989-1 [Araneus ventricosus]